MKEPSENFKAFKSASLHDWEVAALEELNGVNPWEKLIHKGDGWTIQPFYDKKENTHPLPLLTPSESNSLGTRTWHNCPGILVKDTKTANAKALEYLQGGADGIFFHLENEVDFSVLLKSIEWQYCSLNFLANKHQEAIANALYDYQSKNNTTKSVLHGAFFSSDPIHTAIESQFRFKGIEVKTSTSPIEELTSGFLKLIDSLNGNSSQLHQVAFSVTIGNDFFLEIAKLRALRMLWKNYLKARKSTEAIPLLIHAHSLPWIAENFQPHGNMLKSTTSAMAAILGGCDVLTLDPENQDQAMMSRMARNISNVLREESFFSKVADPLAGSYFIEDLSGQLTDAAWQLILPELS